MALLEIIFLGFTVTAYFATAQDCLPDYSSTIPIPVRISDTDGRGTILFQNTTAANTKISGNTSCLSWSDGCPYFEAAIIGNDLVLSATNAFETFEKLETSSGFPYLVPLMCGSGSQADYRFTVSVSLSNNLDPEFIVNGDDSISQISVEVSMPFPIGLPLNQFPQTTIQVIDYDIRGNDLLIDLDAESSKYLTLNKKNVLLGDQGNKNAYELSLVTSQLLNFEDERTAIITASDGLNNQTLEIVLKPDPVNTVPPSPWFEQAMYRATIEYTMEANADIDFEGNNIRITEGYSSDITLALDPPEYEDFFHVTHQDSGEVKITLVKQLEDAGLVAFVVHATRNEADKIGRTAIVLTIHKEDPTTTTSTTEAPTTEGCPTTVFETTVTDCSLCPTVSTTECPVCPTESTVTTESIFTSTCPVCPTETTANPSESTCPTCPDCSTGPDISTCPPCTTGTTSVYTASSDSSPTVFPPTTACDCSTCPTDNPISSSCPVCPTETSHFSDITACPTVCPECPTGTGSDTSSSSSKTQCPDFTTTCPSTTLCPDCPTTCPDCSTTLHPTTCPDCPTSCPDCPTTCPDCFNSCPTSITEFSSTHADCSQCPTNPTECPICPSTCPTIPETSVCPECPASSPFECTTPTLCPECPTTCPATPSSCPECPTTCPTTPSSCPECPSSHPTEGTTNQVSSSSEQITRATEVYSTSSDQKTETSVHSTSSETTNIHSTNSDHTPTISHQTTVFDCSICPTDSCVTTDCPVCTCTTEHPESSSCPACPTECTTQGTTNQVSSSSEQFTGTTEVHSTSSDQKTETSVHSTSSDSTNIHSTNSDHTPTISHQTTAFDCSICPTDNCVTSGCPVCTTEHPESSSCPACPTECTTQGSAITHDPSENATHTTDHPSFSTCPSVCPDCPVTCPECPTENPMCPPTQGPGGAKPIFTVASPYVIGYPDKDVTSSVIPQNVVILQATVGGQIVSGINYEITDNSDQFVIHSVSGVVYPTESFDYSSTKFEVKADAGGLTSDTLEVQIKVVSAEHLVVMNIEGQLPEDILGNYFADAEEHLCTVRVLQSAVVPRDNNIFRRFSPRDDPDSLLYLIVYALNTTSWSPLLSTDFIPILNGINRNWEVSKLEISTSGDGDSQLLPAVIALGVLLGIFVLAAVGAALFYFLKIRPRTKNDFHEYDNFSEGDNNSLNKDSSVMTESSPTFESRVNYDSQHKYESLEEYDSPNNYESAYSYVPSPSMESSRSDERGIPVDVEPSKPTFYENNISMEFDNSSEIQPRKSFVKISDSENEETSDDKDPAGTMERRKSIVTFNENVEQLKLNVCDYGTNE